MSKQAERLSRRTLLSFAISAVGVPGLGMLAVCGATAATPTAAATSAGGGTPASAVGSAAVASTAPTTTSTTARSSAPASSAPVSASSSSAPVTTAVGAPTTTSTVASAATSSVQVAGTTPLVVMHEGSTVDQTVIQQQIDHYTAAHPPVVVQLQQITQDYYDKLEATIAGGTPPDVFAMAEGVVQFAAKGVMADLTPIMEQTGFDRGDFFPKALQRFAYQGKQQGIPARGGPMVLYYSADQFHKVGAALPTADWTWQDFIESGKKLTTGTGAQKTYGMGYSDWWPWWMTPIYQNGGSVLNADKTQATMDTAPAVEALQWFADWFQKDAIAPSPTAAKTMQDGPDQQIIPGSVGMDETGFWAVSANDQAKDFAWGAVPLPKNHQRATMSFLNAWCLTQAGRQHGAAFGLVADGLTSPWAEQLIATTREDMPTRQSVAQSAAFRGTDPATHTQAFLASEADVVDEPITPQWSQMLDATGKVIDDLIAGKVDASTAGKTMTQQVNALLHG